MRAVADIGAPFGIRYYLEPVAWTPLGSLARAVEVIDAAERDNVGLVLDFWHLWQRGTTPDDVARLDRRFISGVDFADSLGPAGSPAPDQRSRCVWPGEGEIPLREWVAAVRATGFDGWWDNELYSPLHWEWPDPFAVGTGLRAVLGGLLDGSADTGRDIDAADGPVLRLRNRLQDGGCGPHASFRVLPSRRSGPAGSSLHRGHGLAAGGRRGLAW